MLSDKLANNATWAIVVKESFTYREFEGCLALFKQYKAIATSTKEPIVYNFFLQGCFKKDKLDHAAHCYDEMKQSVKLNTITYSIMINGYLQKGELAKAECITAELVVNLAATPPIVDNLFLQYYLGVGDLEKAMDYFKKLKDLGSCDEFTYSALIKFMVQRDNINEARAYLEEMKASGLAITTLSYTSLLTYYLEKNDFDSALSLLKEMKAQKVKFDSTIRKIFIKKIVHQPDISRSEFLIKGIELAGYRLNAIFYDALVHYAAATGFSSLATNYYDKLLATGRYTNLYFLLLFLKMESKNGNRWALDLLIKKIRRQGYYFGPEFILKFFNYFLAGNDLSAAFAFIEALLRNDITIPAEVTDYLFTRCIPLAFGLPADHKTVQPRLKKRNSS